MCDYSLHAVASRPAKVGEMLIATSFSGGTRGFAAEGEPKVAVCLLPGTELAFDQDVKYDQIGFGRSPPTSELLDFAKSNQAILSDIMTRSNSQTETSFS